MPNGTLCKRRDKDNCPYHGKIIPRDDEGNPINPEDVKNIYINNKESISNNKNSGTSSGNGNIYNFFITFFYLLLKQKNFNHNLKNSNYFVLKNFIIKNNDYLKIYFLETFLTKKRRLNEIKQAKEKATGLVDVKKINSTPKNRIMNALRKKEKNTNVDAILKYDAKMKYRNKKAFLWE